MRDVAVAGIGMTRFGNHLGRSLNSLAREAAGAAIADAGITPTEVQSVMFSNAAAGVLSGQEMIRGQVALRGSGLEGRPILNTENACASGSSAAYLAWLSVASGHVDVALAVGAEKLIHEDRRRSIDAIATGMDRNLPQPSDGTGSAMMSAYAAEATTYTKRFGPIAEALAWIAVKNRAHAAANERAQFRDEITTEDVANSRVVAEPLRLLMCSPLTDGAAAIVLTAASQVNGPTARPEVTLAAIHIGSHHREATVVRNTVQRVLSSSGMSPQDLDLLQLHDACAYAELVQYEQVGLVPEGQASDAVLSGRFDLDGDLPVNTDGGLMSRGHALGATGLAQLVELAIQLRGEAGRRQVEGVRSGLAVNAGGWMGSDYASCTATLLHRA